MRANFFVLNLLAATVLAAQAQNATTALSALRLIPRPEAKRLARIEAREGNPTPERWYFVVHDPQGENGLREYVVSGGEIVAARGISQFAESVRPEEVIGAEIVKVDSERAARVVQQFAVANGVSAASINYQLRRDSDLPAWTATAVDSTGKRLGEVVLDATSGAVISHGGFPREPSLESAQPPRAEERQRVREKPTATPLPAATPRRVANRAPVRADPVKAPDDDNPMKKIGNRIQKLFGGGR